ncbi:hypothetical protein [Paraglaciecola sp. MB-3u-78]|uniref:hypothetical protein n=1 Tax=Paraglaciecola sp. MB-3u-78 TaxID=2058332 RepID=UPI000C3239B2|nr:hypothetical protein [Paraglaciecola sp. MB-3u-78]PKG98618.1 hypothetical protein CXF95_12130 [Paraglaciecola sp. MB-3u-78]
MSFPHLISVTKLCTSGNGKIRPWVYLALTAWVLNKAHIDTYKPVFFRLTKGNEEEKRDSLVNKLNKFDEAAQSDFKKIPGFPLSYWFSNEIPKIFSENNSLKNILHINIQPDHLITLMPIT